VDIGLPPCTASAQVSGTNPTLDLIENCEIYIRSAKAETENIPSTKYPDIPEFRNIPTGENDSNEILTQGLSVDLIDQ